MKRFGSLGFIGTSLLVACCTNARATFSEPAFQFGVVALRSDTLCLQVEAKLEQLSGNITVILPQERRAVQARVLSPLPSCPNPPNGSPGFYLLNAPEFHTANLGIAILAPSVTILDGARTDLDGNGVRESYRTCASGEGLHLTVWAGDALRSKRIWHAYYYLGYDLQPDCVEADYSE